MEYTLEVLQEYGTALQAAPADVPPLPFLLLFAEVAGGVGQSRCKGTTPPEVVTLSLEVLCLLLKKHISRMASPAAALEEFGGLSPCMAEVCVGEAGGECNPDEVLPYLLRRGLLHREGLSSTIRAVFREGRWEVLRYLIERGVDTGSVPISAAFPDGAQISLFGSVETRKERLRRLLVEHRYDDCVAECFRAVRSGELYTLSELLDAGVDPNTPGLAQAAAGDAPNPSLCLLALELIHGKGGGLSGADAQGRTPCVSAASRGVTPVVEYILEQGGDVRTGWPVIRAMEAGEGGVLELLLSSGKVTDQFVEYFESRDR
eukprot:Hpha_TRINITY_DN14269_c0_g2::TRINITY_DN14269_c0_g2_i1::g.22445::m.22445